VTVSRTKTLAERVAIQLPSGFLISCMKYSRQQDFRSQKCSGGYGPRGSRLDRMFSKNVASFHATLHVYSAIPIYPRT
jgi:hypothetical protein